MDEPKIIIKKWEVNKAGNVIITTVCPICKLHETRTLDRFLNLPKYVRCYSCEQVYSTIDAVKDLTALRGSFI